MGQPENALVASARILVPNWFQATEVPQDISINVLMWTGCTANRMLAQCCNEFNKVLVSARAIVTTFPPDSHVVAV